jgi:hypothetical protein
VLSEREVIERAFAAIDALVENRTADREMGAVSGRAPEAGPEPATILTPESRMVPPLEAWPESLADLAGERTAQTGDAEVAREEVWISYCEFLARGLNRIFDEHGSHGPGRKPANITAVTVQDGMERGVRRESKR